MLRYIDIGYDYKKLDDDNKKGKTKRHRIYI